MEICSLQSQTLSTIPSPLSRNGLIVKSFGSCQILKFPSSKKFSHPRKLKLPDFKAQASGTINICSEAVGATPTKADSKDDNLAFVAGATGKVGSRTVRELLKLGFRVRAGVRSVQRAENLVQSVKQMKLDGELANKGIQPVEMLELVECDLEKRVQIEPALGNASVVICCIGASEKEVFDITGPYRIDFQATKNLVDAATIAKVNHFIMVSSLGTNKFGFPAAILNLFWGVLIWKRKAEEALIASGLPYTIVRPGGMERPTDAYKETHNITLSQEDTLFGGQVSNLQVAELLACMAKNRSLSYCKVVEVIAETTAPLTPMEELLAKIPSQRAEPKESIAPEKSDPAASKSMISEESSAPITEEPVQTKAKVTDPLSPYTSYEDLKPSTSPTPTAPPGKKDSTIVDGLPMSGISDAQTSTSGVKTGITEMVSAPEELSKARPLSPYFAYEDLKPPSSPSPTPSGPKEVLSSSSTTGEVASQLTGGNDVAKTPDTSLVEKNPIVNSIHYHSPYHMYEDLKPPTSPIPSPKKY
ncbi:protein TIC 62 [Citrus sinensis]|uniref:protein TIC 62, chloroplastic isoform X1 n=1 Tax=Citrus sinensis TaxID=2711 RepID=UPI0021915BFC|nr:protein TIC 62, chloroplastic isoform X1 [Citrus sinensis]XP_006479364.2 protein TIC 62, chloroplastic isoform X1 [Citrus sinensis]XP_024955249.2 protein TIC 62, chloroplastic isoform X1 [Citrus sinensis]KAH9656380.1 protein TIC 62 [Citrus sinensis]